MPFYRKKPVIIEALRFDGVVHGEGGVYNVLFDTEDTLPKWLRDALIDETIFAVAADPDYVFIKTLEGLMEAQAGDWIIKGVRGELYPCKPEIFAATYEAAPEPEHDVVGVAI